MSNTKDCLEKSGEGGTLLANRSKSAMRCIAMTHQMAYERPGLAVIARAIVDIALCIGTSSGWAEGERSRKSCAGCYIECNVGAVYHCGNTQTNAALPLAVVELDSAARGVSEGIGVKTAMQEVFNQDPRMILHIGASTGNAI